MESFPFRFGSYELIDLLATGGMAEIFRARVPGQEPTLAKLVAIKRILPTFSKNENFVRLFEKEIGLATSLSHPNLVKIYDSGIVGNQYYIAMEYVHGKPLDALASRCAENGQQIPVDFTCYVIREVCTALAYAHNLKDKVSGKFVGIIHRDISPQNVIFSYEGHVKLFDFGVAKVMARDSSTVGGFQGKPAYMAPEQARGEDLDSRTDIFSLGVVLWELLTGQRLFSSDQPLLAIKNVIEKPVVPPSSINPMVPKILDAIVLKALQRPMEARYQSAQQFAVDLDKVLKSISPSFGKEQAAKFIGSVLGLLIERENAELYSRMHAEATAGSAQGGLELEQTPLSQQPEWRRAVAERTFGGEKEPVVAPIKPRPAKKHAIEEVAEPSSFKGLWYGFCLIACLGLSWVAYEVGSSFLKAAEKVNAVPPPEVPQPVAITAPVAPPPEREPAKEASPQLDSGLGSFQPETAACDVHSRPVCAFTAGAPTTFKNSCDADAVKAVLFYSGECDPKLVPAVRYNVFRLRDSEWRWAADTKRAAVFGDMLEIEIELVNFPPAMRMQAALIAADGKAVKVYEMPVSTAVLALGKELPRGTYDLEIRVLDGQGAAFFVNKANQPFFLGVPADMKMRVINTSAPGP